MCETSPPLMTYDCPARPKATFQFSGLCNVKSRKYFVEEVFSGDHGDVAKIGGHVNGPLAQDGIVCELMD